MQPICRAELVAKVIPGGGGTAGSLLKFDTQPALDGVYVVGFEAFTAAQAAFDPNRVATLPAADALNVLITLCDGSDQRFQNMPFNALIAALNAGVWKEIDPTLIDWQKSFAFFTAAATAGTSILILFYYMRPEDMDDVMLANLGWSTADIATMRKRG